MIGLDLGEILLVLLLIVSVIIVGLLFQIACMLGSILDRLDNTFYELKQILQQIENTLSNIRFHQ